MSVVKRQTLGMDEGEQPELVRSSLLLRQALRKGSVMSATLLERNANSHAGYLGHGCPSTPAMQHSGGTDLTAALHR